MRLTVVYFCRYFRGLSPGLYIGICTMSWPIINYGEDCTNEVVVDALASYSYITTGNYFDFNIAQLHSSI